MLPTEILLMVGVGLVAGGRVLTIAGKSGLAYVRDRAQRIVDSQSAPLYKRLIINTHLDHLEREHSALKVVHAQTVIANTMYLDRITRLESLLHSNGIAVPREESK